MQHRAPLAMCWAGGGGYGVGYAMGLAAGLQLGGIDVVGAPMIGTSAGSITIAALAAGISFDELVPLWEQNDDFVGSRFFVESSDLADTVFPGDRPLAQEVVGMAVKVRSWRRVALSSNRYRVADIVAASSAVMPIVRPHRIDGHWYVDGGHISNSSVDRAPLADLLLFVNPFTDEGMGMIGRALSWRVRYEMRQYLKRGGGDILEIGPTPEIARSFSPTLNDVANIDIGEAVYDASVEYGQTVAAEIIRLYPDLPGRLAATR